MFASLTIAEIHRGILEKPGGKKRTALETWFGDTEGPRALFAGRIFSFDEKAALIWGELMVQGKAAGRSRSALDTIVAAIARSNGCVVVTDNERDFTGSNLSILSGKPPMKRPVALCSRWESNSHSPSAFAKQKFISAVTACTGYAAVRLCGSVHRSPRAAEGHVLL